VPESRPSAIRFAEDVLPRAKETEEERRPARKRRGSRFEEEDDEMEEIDYSGRIH
jgi:hypothetical protein